MCNIVAVHPETSAVIVTGEAGEISVTVGETVVETQTLYEWTPYVLCGTEGDWAHDSEVTVDKGEMDQLYYYEHHLIAKSVSGRKFEDGTFSTFTKEYFYDEDIWQVTKIVETQNDGTVYVKTAEFDENGNFIKGYADDVLRVEHIYENGNLVENITYDFDGNPEWFTTYTYDDENRMTGWERTNTSGMGFAFTYTYDALGNVISEKRFNVDPDSENNSVLRLFEETVRTYDESGTIVKEINYSYEAFIPGEQEAVIRVEEVFNYENGNLVYQTRTNMRDGSVAEHKYEYNDRNQRVSGTHIIDGEVFELITYTYDEEGRQTSVVSVDAEGNEIGKTLNIYTETDEIYSERTESYTEGVMTGAYENGYNQTTNESWYYEFDNIGEKIYEHISIGKEVDGQWVESYTEANPHAEYFGENTYQIVKLPDTYQTDYWYHDSY